MPDPETYDYMIVGYNDRVFVSVVCVPRSQNAWVAVSAYADDTLAAEDARNRVRADIVRMVSFD